MSRSSNSAAAPLRPLAALAGVARIARIARVARITRVARLARIARVALLLAGSLGTASAQILPPGFSLETLPGAVLRPTDLALAGDGSMYVTTKAGQVHRHDGLGFQASACLDLADEVNNFSDRGLVGLALHPGFVPDGGASSWIYLLYTASPLLGQDVIFDFDDMYSFGRLTRYRADTLAGEVLLDPFSRQVLLGNQLPDGSVPDALPHVHLSHTGGTLLFADDGSLFVLTGEGAHYNLVDTGGADDPAFDDWTHPVTGLKGPLPKEQDAGAFRAQSLDSLGGKVLRLDPETGDGYASNPFYDGDPTSHASRVWALGLRNPFRAALLPGSGQTDPALGDPNPLAVGDVGWGDREELNLCHGGENFGWPCSEGFGPSFGYPAFDPPAPTFPNCNTAQHGLPTPPAMAWGHSDPAQLSPPGAHVDESGAPQPGFFGTTVIGGVWYPGGPYPAQYAERVVFADFGWSWLRTLDLSLPGLPLARDFAQNILLPVDLERDPVSGELIVLHFFLDAEGGGLSRLRFAEAWVHVGNGLAGSGPAPQLSGSGPLEPGTSFLVELDGLLPASTVFMFLGFSELGASFKGGVMVPDPAPPGFDFVLPSGTGDVNLHGTWPLDAPPGLPFWLQAWQADPLGPKGAAASNALRGTGH